MSKMSKREARAHAEACRILDKPGPLTLDEKWFVLENWREDARHMNNLAGAYFTPVDLARDFSVEVPGGRVLDLCAGIGTLSFMVYHLAGFGPKPEIVCAERFVDMVASMTRAGDRIEGPDGPYEYSMDPDDAMETLNRLIFEARALTSARPDNLLEGVDEVGPCPA